MNQNNSPFFPIVLPCTKISWFLVLCQPLQPLWRVDSQNPNICSSSGRVVNTSSDVDMLVVVVEGGVMYGFGNSRCTTGTVPPIENVIHTCGLVVWKEEDIMAI
mgnify:CR=1 FL=1|jgi:hypothetical protein